MIRNKSRAWWFGASDTSHIMGNWGTKSFARWWLEKIGLRISNYSTMAMMAGTAYEHNVLDAIGVSRKDRQIRKFTLRLRVNLDGETRMKISEVKTWLGEKEDSFSVSKSYWEQCQVEMYAAKKECQIVAYRVTEDEYKNYFLPIEQERISFHPIQYDEKWINEQYLPRLRYFVFCMIRRKLPGVEEFNENKELWECKNGISKLMVLWTFFLAFLQR